MFPSISMVGKGLTGDALMKVHPEQTITDFAYGDVVRAAAEGINIAKGAELLIVAIDENPSTDFPLLVETSDGTGRTMWITTWNVEKTGVNLADQLPPQELGELGYPQEQSNEEEVNVKAAE